MRLKVSIIFTLCLCSLGLSGQNKTCSCCLSGKVLDEETSKPIPYATVQVKDTNKFAQTNEDGEFIIKDTCPNEYTLIISCLGYSSTTSDHHHEQDSNRHFYLTQDVTGLDEVTIQAQRAKEKGTETIAQTTLTKADIQSTPTESLAVSLSKIEGVTFAATGTNIQLPVIQGLTGNRIVVLNNDIKHAFQNWGQDHAPEIDINAANSVTVIKGAAGVRFGPEALSGAVLVKPNPLLLNNEFYGSFRVNGQSNGRGGNTNFEIGQGTENWSYFFNGGYTRLGDRFAPGVDLTDEEIEAFGINGNGDTEPVVNLTNTGKEEISFGAGLRYRLDDWDFKAYYSYVDQDFGLLFSSFLESPNSFSRALDSPVPLIVNDFSYNISDPNQELQHHFAKAEVDWRYADQGKLSFRFGAQLNLRDEFDVRRNAEIPIIDLDLLTFDYQLEWEHPTWNGLDGFIGVQYFTQNNDNNPGTQTTPFIPNYDAERFSAFVIENVKFGENTLEAGVRFDIETNDVAGREVNQDIFRDQYTFTNFTASLGYQWELSDNSSFKTNVGSAFRTPNVAELFSFGQQGFRSVFGLLRLTNNDGVLSTSEVTPIDESEVDLERGYKLTNEFRTSNENNAHVVTTYVHYIENFVFDRPLGVFGSVRGPQFAFFIDQADALFVGLDYSWKKQISSVFSATYGLSYLWSRNIGEGEALFEQAPISTNLQFQWDQGAWWVFDSSTLSVRPSYTFRQFQAPRTVSPESLIDGIEVITPDSEIFDFIDAPDGYFLADLSWNFKISNFGGSISAQNLLNTRYRSILNEARYFSDELGRNVLVGLNYNF